MRTLHFGLRVADLERSLAFYTAVGYEVVGRVPETPFGSLTMLKLPDDDFVTIELVHDPSNTADDLGAGLNHFVIKVESMDAAITQLAAQGIRADTPGSPDGSDDFLTSWVTDPDGNRIELVQWPAGHPDGITAQELDVRPLRKTDKHPKIFATYNALPVGGAFVLINDHDPKHLREEFEVDHPGSHGWEYLRREPRDWRVRISKLASTPLPRVLARTGELVADPGTPDVAGAVWKLQMRERDLDSNVIALPPGGTIGAHTGPEADVLIHVLAGSGQLTTELDTLDLDAGTLVWLPRRARRQFTAGPDGLCYLTVHQRRHGLTLDTARTGADR